MKGTLTAAARKFLAANPGWRVSDYIREQKRLHAGRIGMPLKIGKYLTVETILADVDEPPSVCLTTDEEGIAWIHLELESGDCFKIRVTQIINAGIEAAAEALLESFPPGRPTSMTWIEAVNRIRALKKE